MDAQDFLAMPLTLHEMVDVIHHLKRINLFDGSVPQAPKRPQLKEILRQSWTDLIAFYETSILQGQDRAERD